MNLRQIIRESINNVILDSIISDAIINEVTLNEKNYNAGKKKQRGYNRKQKQQNLQQKRQQNVNQTVKTPQGGVTQTPQVSTTQTPQDSVRQTNATNQQQTVPQQAAPQEVANFKQFSDELRKLVGNSGIDPKPVQNNQQAVEHIDTLNHFVFNVIDAIDNGNIDSASSPAAGKGNNAWYNPYGKDSVDIARDAMRGSVNYLGNGAENLLGRGANNPLNGVFKAGVNAYNNTNSAFTQLMNNRERANAYGNKPQTIPSASSLTELMKIYPGLLSEYQQIDQQANNIFSATPDVGNCYTVLQNLHTAVANYQKTKSQQAQNGQNTQGGQSQTPQGGQGQTPQGGQGQTTQGGTVAPGKGNATPSGGETAPAVKTGGKTNTTKKPPIDDAVKKAATNPLGEDWEETVGKLGTLQQECHNFSYEKNMNDDIKNLFVWNANFLENIVSASDNNNEEQLMNLLSVNDKNGDNLGTYSGIKKKYEEALKQYGKDPQENGYLKTLYYVLTYSNVLRSQLIMLKNNNR